MYKFKTLKNYYNIFVAKHIFKDPELVKLFTFFKDNSACFEEASVWFYLIDFFADKFLLTSSLSDMIFRGMATIKISNSDLAIALFWTRVRGKPQANIFAKFRECKSDICYGVVTFEEAFERMPREAKMSITYNLDLFETLLK